jgi:tRNA pseudouridine55 synthase
MGGVTLDDARAAAATLTGDIAQVPPMVSAKKVGGQRLHALARQGVEVERAAVPVHVETFDVGPAVAPGVYPVAVACSSGTYVRSLAADLGTALGGGAHLRNLRRVSVGPYGLDEAVALESLAPECLLPPVEALRGRPRVVADDDLAAAVRHGRVLPAATLGVEGDGPWAVTDASGALLAVYHPHRGTDVKPGVVLASA